MEQKAKNQIAFGIAIACGVAVLAWKYTHPSDTSDARKRVPSGDVANDPRATTIAATSTGGAGAMPSASAHAGPHLDRKQADEMRERIRALLAEAGPAWARDDSQDAALAPAAAGMFPEMPSGDERDDAGRSESAKYIQRRVREDLFPLARQCYDAQLAKNPTLAGRFIMHFRIVGDRRVGGVVDTAYADDAGTLTDPEFSRCMTESMMSITFDAPPGKSGQVTVTYPIEFSPEEDDSGANAPP